MILYISSLFSIKVIICSSIVKQFIQGTMYRLFLFSTLLLVCVCVPRTPRIYNVLISTKKNLSPSHALPVYEPVLRTTSLGVAFPPFYYEQIPIQTIQPTPNIQPNRIVVPENVQGKSPSDQVQVQEQDEGNFLRHQPQPLQQFENIQEQYVPYDYNPNGGYYQQQPQENREERRPEIDFEKYYENVNDPKNVIANLKKNPDIPDVPPPALPVKS